MNTSSPLESIFFAALEKTSPRERAEFLDQACVGDAELRRRVEKMLEAPGKAASFLESPALTLQAAKDHSPREEVGAVIGPYTLLQLIGEGGMGDVYMAEQTRPVRRKVALKLIKPGIDCRQVIARFEAERQALAMMDHVNIARVFDGGTTETGRRYFVMELVHGVPITQYCDDNRLTPRERLELFVPVCQAIQHAHQKGVIHRDIKPSNVMVTLYDGKPVPKVIDFGVAKATEQKLTERTLFTHYGAMVGTLEYMSPEQAEMSALGVDTRSDIYSLGVLLYELLTGSTPLGRERVRQTAYPEIVRIIKEEEPPPPSTRLCNSGETLVSISAQRQMEPTKLTKLVKGELDWIVMKCVEKDRNRRYETASALAADVLRYLRDESVEACPPSVWRQCRKFARRNRRGLMTSAVVASAVMLTAAASGVLIWRANRDLLQSLENERRTAYVQRIALAEREWGANNLSRMEALLEDCPEELRHWEWRYLKRRRFGVLPPLRHESGVYSVAFSPDSKLLATATKDGFVRLWDAKTGQQRQMWRAHDQNNATCVAFSPDGRRLASAGWDATVKLWDVQRVLQGEAEPPLLRLEHPRPLRLWSVCFSPDGDRLASAGGREAEASGELRIWDLGTGHTLLAKRRAWVVACAQFSPDGQRLAICSDDLVQVLDAKTGREQLACRDLQGSLRWLSFSPDGRRIAAVGGLFAVHPDREVKVWDTQTGEEVLSLRGHVGGLRFVAFSPDGDRIVTTGLDQTVKLWDASTGQEVLSLRGHMDNAFAVAFSPDGRKLASACLDMNVRIWDASPVEPDSGPEWRTLRGHRGAVTDVAFHPTDQRIVATAGADGTVRVWDFPSGKELVTFPCTPSAFRLRLAYSPDGKRLAVVSSTQSAPIRIWDTESGREICRIAPQLGADLCVAFSPDGRRIATAGFDFKVRVWDAATGKEIMTLGNHDWPIHGVAFSPDGRRLASGGADRTVRLLDLANAKELCVLEPWHASRVSNVAFSRDGSLLASAGWDRTIKVWEAESGRLLHDLHDPADSAAQCVVFGRDSKRLVWGAADGAVKVWDGRDSEIQVLRGHRSWIQAVAISPDGKWIASASLDGAAKIWKAPPPLPSVRLGAAEPALNRQAPSL